MRTADRRLPFFGTGPTQLWDAAMPDYATLTTLIEQLCTRRSALRASVHHPLITHHHGRGFRSDEEKGPSEDPRRPNWREKGREGEAAGATPSGTPSPTASAQRS